MQLLCRLRRPEQNKFFRTRAKLERSATSAVTEKADGFLLPNTMGKLWPLLVSTPPEMRIGTLIAITPGRRESIWQRFQRTFNPELLDKRISNMAQTNSPNRNHAADSVQRVGNDAKQMGQDIKQAAQDVQGAVMEKTSEVAQSVKDLGAQAATAAQEQFEKARGAAEQQYEALRETAGEYLQQGRQRAMEMEKQVQSRIVEKPMQSIMIAAGIGFVLGVIMSRR
jgi:ElaB/YqjD/DUF883 family membrane-anchored ribosome-binding protein